MESIGRRHLITRGAAVGGSLLAGTQLAQAQDRPAAGQSTVDRVRSSGALRIGVIPDEAPFFVKDLISGEWSGIALDMARDIASHLGVRLAFVETTYGNSVLDLQSDKIDLAFALNPTPARALAIAFSTPYYRQPFGTLSRRGFEPKTWGDLNKPNLKIGIPVGNSSMAFIRRFAPQAEVVGLRNLADVVLALQAGRVDSMVSGAMPGLNVQARNRTLGRWTILTDPTIALPSAMGLQPRDDWRWKSFIDAWVEYATGTGLFREWFVAGLNKLGLPREEIPPSVGF